MSAQIQLPIAQHNPEDLVFISQTNQIATDSFLVAKFFSKQHKHVLEKVRSIDCSKEFAESNFWLCHKNNELQNNKLQPFYQMTKDGFLFLVMGFTGKKAAQIKEAYINAFNLMAEKLSKPKPLPAENLPMYKDLVDLKSHVNFRMLVEIKSGQPSNTQFIPDDAFICNKERLLELLTFPRVFSDEDVSKVYKAISSRLPESKPPAQLPKPSKPKALTAPVKSPELRNIEDLPNKHEVQIIRVKEVMEITGFARSTLYSIEKYNPDFPKRVRIGVKAVGWMKHEVEEWVQKRPYIA